MHQGRLVKVDGQLPLLAWLTRARALAFWLWRCAEPLRTRELRAERLSQVARNPPMAHAAC